MKRILCLALAIAGIPAHRAFADIIDLKPLISDLHSARSERPARGGRRAGEARPGRCGGGPRSGSGPGGSERPGAARSHAGDRAYRPGGSGRRSRSRQNPARRECQALQRRADALGAIGRDSLEAAPVLIDLLKGDDAAVATSAGLALTRIMPDDENELQQVVPILVAALQDKRSQVRSTAIVARGDVGTRGRASPGPIGQEFFNRRRPGLAGRGGAGAHWAAGEPAVAALSMPCSRRSKKSSSTRPALSEQLEMDRSLPFPSCATTGPR